MLPCLPQVAVDLAVSCLDTEKANMQSSKENRHYR